MPFDRVNHLEYIYTNGCRYTLRLPSRENHLSATYMGLYINMNVDKRKHATNLGVIFDCKWLLFPLETFPDFLYPEKFDEGTINR